MSDGPLAFIKDALAGVEREAKESVGDRIYVTWSEHYNNWIDFFQPLLKELSDFEKFNLMIVFRLAAELSRRIAAVAPVSGHFWLNDSKLDYPVSLIFFAGTEDPLNPLLGGEVRSPWGIVEKKPPVSESVLKWVKLLGCPAEPKVLYDKDGVKAVVYAPGRGGSEVVSYTIEGMGHTWPGGKSLLPERLVGKMTHKIKATDVIWEFFQNHPKKV